MSIQSKPYRRLPGKKKGFLIGRYTLWEGKDHLLHVYSRFGVEDYKRFYFSDIQAIITHKTVTGKIQNIVMGVMLGFFVLMAFSFNGGLANFYAILAGIMILFLIINTWRGPTCETHLLTAVQTEKLPSLQRLQKTFQVMEHLRTLIKQSQGTLSSGDLKRRPVRRPLNRTTSGARSHLKSLRKAAKPIKGYAHLAVFALLLLDALMVAVGFFFTHLLITLLSFIAGLGVAIMVIIAVVKQQQSDMQRTLRTVTWTALGYIYAKFVAGYVVRMVYFAGQTKRIADPVAVLEKLTHTSPWDSALFLGFDIVILCGSLLLGVFGLILLKQYKETARIPSASANVSAQGSMVPRGI